MEVAHDLFKATAVDEKALVATIDLLLKTIVGFSTGSKIPRLLPKAQ